MTLVGILYFRELNEYFLEYDNFYLGDHQCLFYFLFKIVKQIAVEKLPKADLQTIA